MQKVYRPLVAVERGRNIGQRVISVRVQGCENTLDIRRQTERLSINGFVIGLPVSFLAGPRVCFKVVN